MEQEVFLTDESEGIIGYISIIEKEETKKVIDIFEFQEY